MNLDRNTNRGGHGKYALVNMRKLLPILEKRESAIDGRLVPTEADMEEMVMAEHFLILVERGIISLGNETPGDQFFVMKYKDKFTACALQAYAVMAHSEADRTGDNGLKEYAEQMSREARDAAALGNRIPD